MAIRGKVGKRAEPLVRTTITASAFEQLSSGNAESRLAMGACGARRNRQFRFSDTTVSCGETVAVVQSGMHVVRTNKSTIPEINGIALDIQRSRWNLLLGR